MTIYVKNTVNNVKMEEDDYVTEFINEVKISNHEDALNLVSSIVSKYTLSGIISLRNILVSVSNEREIDPFIRVHAAQGLLVFKESEDPENTEEDDTLDLSREYNQQVKIRNEERLNIGLESVSTVCADICRDSNTVPIALDLIKILLPYTIYLNDCIVYMKQIVINDILECPYRYKSLLDLASIAPSQFMIECAFEFIYNVNMTVYKILAAQFLLQKKLTTDEQSIELYDILLNTANDNEMDYNVRADAADVLIGLGTPEYRDMGRNIIIALGITDGISNTLYSDRQNVHRESIEESVQQILTLIFSFPIKKIHGFDVTLPYVFNDIGLIIETSVAECKDKNCNIMEYCAICKNQNTILNKLKNITFNRIQLDRKEYGTNGYYLSSILIKIWSYIQNSEHKDELMKRLIEELYEMGDTCSTGYCSRLANVFSGFEERLSIRISFEDQIQSDVLAMLNTRAQDIKKANSKARRMVNDIVEVYLYEHRELMLAIITHFESESKQITKESLIQEYLRPDPDTRFEECLDNFYEQVLCELQTPTNYDSIPNLLLFMRMYLSEVREELSEKYKNDMSPSDFDMCFRKALSSYQGISLV